MRRAAIVLVGLALAAFVYGFLTMTDPRRARIRRARSPTRVPSRRPRSGRLRRENGSVYGFVAGESPREESRVGERRRTGGRIGDRSVHTLSDQRA